MDFDIPNFDPMAGVKRQFAENERVQRNAIESGQQKRREQEQREIENNVTLKEQLEEEKHQNEILKLHLKEAENQNIQLHNNYEKLEQIYNIKEKELIENSNALKKSRKYNCWMMIIAIIAMLGALASPIITYVVTPK
ncbi:MAG: hypothetical protein ACYCVD_09435 [Desulfitobacteriaceae bacterium]